MLRASIQLLADATPREGHDGAISEAGDFALYNCSACHHELQSPSPRQARGYFDGRPGRPQLRSWNTSLATAALVLQGASDERAAFLSLAALLAPLQSAIGDRPFGDAEAVRTAARDAVGQLNQAIAGLQDKRWHARESQRLIEQICRAGGAATLRL